MCGTDREIVAGRYGWAPPGSDRLVLGHEWLGRVCEAPPGGDIDAGELVAGIVRRPDPQPCPCCGRGEFDMCRNGRYRERGIKELDGYGAELVTLEPGFAVQLDPSLGVLGVLTEPTSVLAKAWEQIDRVAAQACRPLECVLVTGAGPIGLLAAMLGVQRGLSVTAAGGVEPQAARAAGRGTRRHRPLHPWRADRYDVRDRHAAHAVAPVPRGRALGASLWSSYAAALGWFGGPMFSETVWTSLVVMLGTARIVSALGEILRRRVERSATQSRHHR